MADQNLPLPWPAVPATTIEVMQQRRESNAPANGSQEPSRQNLETVFQAEAGDSLHLERSPGDSLHLERSPIPLTASDDRGRAMDGL